MAHEAVVKLKELVQTSSEADVRAYINENWDAFPIDVQDHLSSAMFIDALRRDSEQSDKFEQFQDKILEAIEQIVSAK